MARTRNKIRATLIALTTITLLFHFEYQSSDAFTLQRNNQQPVVINGDLAAVDWDSLVGQEVTIAGNLVVVDAWNLARYGQVTVARDRLFVQPNRLTPTMPIPTQTHLKAAAMSRR